MLKIYNSLTKKIEDFQPIHPQNVGFYTCGPTVYSFAHIGNFRTYTNADVLVRTLQLEGYKVTYVMNITDVGHLTGDNLGDADTGEDRMEKSAQKEGKTAWEVAAFYTEAFLDDYAKLNLTKPKILAKATDHIKEQIALVERLEKKGYTYQISDGVYFDTAKFPDYGKLSNLDEIKEGVGHKSASDFARIAVNEEKKNPKDFALWKFSYPNGVGLEEYKKSRPASAEGFGEARQMEWESPWGMGFPGWHIECSAMSMKYLGETFDIHSGGMDLRETHHPNEIAQSEAATGRRFVNYWMHSAFILVNGEKMSKSKGNLYRVYDLEKENFDPLALRYLYFQTHYRQEMNFTLTSLEAAQNALAHLKNEMMSWDPSTSSGDGSLGTSLFVEKFTQALSNDLNMPEALSVVWEMVKSDIPTTEKLASLFIMDKVLGLDLESYYHTERKKRLANVPSEILSIVKEREELRKQRMYSQADQLRNMIIKEGYDVVDTEKGSIVRKI